MTFGAERGSASFAWESEAQELLWMTQCGKDEGKQKKVVTVHHKVLRLHTYFE